MIDPRSPDFKPIIETDEDASKEWTPARGLRKGMIACLIVGAIMCWAWTAMTCRQPSVMIFNIRDGDSVKGAFGLVIVGILIGFVMTWVLFACMHRMSRMVGWPCVAGVVATVLLIMAARQIVVAVNGVTIAELDVVGWAWLAPRRFFISNMGVWFGLAAAAYLFHEGESFVDLFPSST